MEDGPDYGYGEDRAMADSEPMFDRFTLEIELGNAAMQTPDQVAVALRQVADRLTNRGDFTADDRGTIRDLNGNTVGEYGPAWAE